MDITLIDLGVWALLAGGGFLGGWLTKRAYKPTGICKETGKPAIKGKCPNHGDGGGECGSSPEEIVASYHSRLASMTQERDHFRGKAARMLKNRA